MSAQKSDSRGLDRLAQEARYALRRVRKSPGFAVTVVVTLALGIGVNLAVFQLLHGVLFSSLPVAAPEEMYSLHAVQSPYDAQWFYSYPAYRRLQQASGEGSPVIAHAGISSGVLQMGGGFSERARFQLVSDNFFSVLGLHPAAGRLFVAGEDDRDQAEIPVVLRYEFAKDHFGAVSSILGRRAVLNRVAVVIAGIAPPHFSGVVQGSAPDVWLPLSAQATGRFGSWMDSLGPGYEENLNAPYRNQAAIMWLWVLARVPRGQQHMLAERWTRAIEPDLRMMAAATKDRLRREEILRAQVQLIAAARGEGGWSETYARPLLLLMAMASLVFVAACLNLANMQAARLVSRQREIALRIALGASRARVLRQLLAEDLLVLGMAGAIAFGCCGAASTLLVHWASGRGQTIPVDLRVGPQMLAVGTASMVLAFVAFSVLPAWRAARSNFAAAIKTGVGSIGAQGRTGRRWSGALLAGQVSFSLLLLSMATLFGETLLKLHRADAGFDREHVLSVHLDLRNSGLDRQALPGLDARLLERVKALPEVRDAAAQMCWIPNCVWNTQLHVAGHPELPDAQMHGEENHVSTGYFHTLGIPLLRGRLFTEEDRAGAQPVIILNHAFARQLFGAEDAVGHSIGYKSPPGDREFLIVGEVGDARVDGLRAQAPPVAYLPLNQTEEAAGTLEVRVNGRSAAAADDVRRALHAVEANLPVTEIVSLGIEFEDGFSTERLLARLTSVFGALTLALAAIGFYGLLSFQVARRTSEIGVRMALGATRGRVQWFFLQQTFVILAAGIIPGILLSVVMERAARSVLYGTVGSAPWAFLLAVAVLVMAGLVAALVPARRAAGVDPIKALRSE